MSSGILHSNEAFKYGSLLGEECFKLTGDQDLSIRSPIDREYVVRKFDDGFFHELLMRYETEKGEQLWPLADKFAVFLGADSMVLGVAIGRDDMDILRSALKRVEIDPEARRQMEKALKGYKSNGEGWDFDGHYLGLKVPSNAGRSVPVEEMKAMDKSLQEFLELHNAYKKEVMEQAAKEKGSEYQEEMDNRETW
ncbi:MAG: hypothetical protein ALECFALPRED_004504 [Alectoria fallacina]|uniref:Uncharacterized protein n=1 Tax=Alectoria fallacina TaxID=1903189 RepID=A0A8H3FVW1_9LECA|nr:MAG: hypothetical protein ALECFALPRED_004504 [Alectoria fallacina]